MANETRLDKNDNLAQHKLHEAYLVLHWSDHDLPNNILINIQYNRYNESLGSTPHNGFQCHIQTILNFVWLHHLLKHQPFVQ